MRWIFISIIAALSLLHHLSLASVIYPQKRFDHLTIDQGLSQNTVNAILKDSHGYMWFGTNDGLNQYDGYDLQVYRSLPEDTTSLTNSKIFSIAEDNEGNIWIGTANGLNKYNRALDIFERFYHQKSNNNSLSHNFIRCIYPDTDGKIYLGTLGGGLTIYNTTTRKFFRSANVLKTSADLKIDYVSSIIKDYEGNILLGADINGILLYNTTTDEYSAKVYDDQPLGKISYGGKTLYEDINRDIWICTEGNGLYQWQKSIGKFLHYTHQEAPSGLSGNIIKGIYEVADQLFWIVADGGGLNILDAKTNTIEILRYHPNDKKGINSNALYTIYGDNQGIIWIGTFDGGVNIANPQKKAFEHFTHNGAENSLSHKAVLTFLEQSTDVIWIGTDGGGLNKFYRNSGTFHAFKSDPGNPNSISSNVITSLYLDKNKQLWVGSYQGGLMKYEAHSGFKTYQASQKSGLENNNIWCMLEDSRGNFWIGTLGGLYIFDRSMEIFRKIKDPARPPETNLQRNICMMEDHEGNIWVGGNGISVYNPDAHSWLYYNNIHQDHTSLGVDNVRSIYQDSKKNIWIGTEGAGLHLFVPQTKSFLKWASRDGLPNNSIHQILEDRDGNLWISTNNGLSKLTFENHLLKSLKNYDINDGLQSNQFSYAASLKSSTGEMYFGGVNGFNVFDPKSISINKFAPPVKITGFRINEKNVSYGPASPLSKHISATEEITLNHAQSRVFSIEFTALNFTSPEKNNYAYTLEGFDGEHEWLDAGTRRTATYTNLNDGKYVFKVKAANNDGIWNENPAILKIRVLPPWWKTWYAYLTYAIILVALTLSMRRFTIERIHLKNDIKLKELERQKNEEINQAKLKFFTSISHEFKTPLTLIIGPLRKLMDDFRDNREIQFYHALMYRNAKRLLHLINQLMDFRKIENGKQQLRVMEDDIVAYTRNIKTDFENLAIQKQIDFSFNADFPEIKVLFDKDILDKVLFNLLSNAFKFTPQNGRVGITISNQIGHIELVVEDSGIGIPPEVQPMVFDRYFHLDQSANHQNAVFEGTGIGLALAYELIQMHHGTIDVESIPGQGSKFKLTLPMGETAYSTHEKGSGAGNDVFTHPSVEDYLQPDTKETDYAPEWEISQQDKHKPILLLVEDNLELRAFLYQYLHGDFKILEAGNGRQGLDSAKKYIPDLIVSDIMMPLMDGLEMCALLKKDERTNHIPIILLTARSTVENNIEGLNTGADDYICKPFHAKVLELKIKNLITRQKELQKKYSERIFSFSDEKTPSPEEKFLENIKIIIEHHLGDPEFDVNAFAKEINMSRSVLYRKLKALTGQSVNELLSNLRLMKAAELLANKSLSVSDVAYAVGFSDPQYFSKCFRKKYNTTPSDFATHKNSVL